ncbi:hypothetical protein G6F22_020617 [Rhizopus arrhizus]|nr:hypothetical protein G6F22_020617 [Rhizopus arrhizus]KAG1168678.1 hypothetical protein G6F35_017414 [Rhizopus arrhizus]
MTPVNLLLIAITAILSWMAFNNRKLADRLILWPPAVDRHRQYDRLVTYGFIHADWSHLIFNMITLFFFGGFIESVMLPEEPEEPELPQPRCIRGGVGGAVRLHPDQAVVDHPGVLHPGAGHHLCRVLRRLQHLDGQARW